MATKQSPRNENGIIKWYEGDAFYLPFVLRDYVTKEPFVLGERDKFVVEFFDCRERVIYTCDVLVPEADGLYKVHIDKDVTKRFKQGKYHYKIEYHKNDSETIQTIKDCGDIEVEGYCQCQN